MWCNSVHTLGGAVRSLCASPADATRQNPSQPGLLRLRTSSLLLGALLKSPLDRRLGCCAPNEVLDVLEFDWRKRVDVEYGADGTYCPFRDANGFFNQVFQRSWIQGIRRAD